MSDIFKIPGRSNITLKTFDTNSDVTVKKSKVNQMIDILQKYFECSKLQVKQNLELISKDELIEILNKYGLEKKKIKRIIK